MLFTVIYKPSTKWNHDLPFNEQEAVFEHRDFLAQQLAEGRLFVGGPFLDNQGGIAIFDVPSQSALNELLHADRSIEAQLLSFETHPCVLPFVQERNDNT